MCDNSEDFLYYNTEVQVYSVSTKIIIDRFCNGITILNNGTNNCVFDGETIVPGQSKAISGNRKEIFIGRKDLEFPVAGAGNLAVITQKFYVKLAPHDPHNLDVAGL